jgi:hypothetical protein
MAGINAAIVDARPRTRRTDIYVSTLRSFVQAMGGVEIRAIFPDGTVKIDQFSALASGEKHLTKTAGSSK